MAPKDRVPGLIWQRANVRPFSSIDDRLPLPASRRTRAYLHLSADDLSRESVLIVAPPLNVRRTRLATHVSPVIAGVLVATESVLGIRRTIDNCMRERNVFPGVTRPFGEYGLQELTGSRSLGA